MGKLGVVNFERAVATGSAGTRWWRFWRARRRHLDESQRGMIAARLANLPAYRPSGSSPIGLVTATQSEAAALLNVGTSSPAPARIGLVLDVDLVVIDHRRGRISRVTG